MSWETWLTVCLNVLHVMIVAHPRASNWLSLGPKSAQLFRKCFFPGEAVHITRQMIWSYLCFLLSCWLPSDCVTPSFVSLSSEFTTALRIYPTMQRGVLNTPNEYMPSHRTPFLCSHFLKSTWLLCNSALEILTDGILFQLKVKKKDSISGSEFALKASATAVAQAGCWTIPAPQPPTPV